MSFNNYKDVGAIQHKDSGSPTANTNYGDVGAVQHQAASTTVPSFQTTSFPDYPIRKNTVVSY